MMKSTTFVLAVVAAFSHGVAQCSDGGDLQKLIDRALAAGERTILIPKAVYSLGPGTVASIHLRNVEGVTVDFQGSELRGKLRSGMIRLDGCDDVTVKNAVIDYPERLPFTQGVIRNVGPDGEWDVEILDGYADEPGVWPIQAYDGKSGKLVNPMRLGGEKIARTGKCRYQVSGGRNRRGKIGDVAVWSLDCDTYGNTQSISNRAHAVCLVNCRNCRMEDITVYSTPGSNGFREMLGDGGNTYLRCSVVPRAPESDPVKRSLPRLRSGNHDAFNSRGMKTGPRLIECVARNHCDDDVNIHGPYQYVVSVEGRVARAFVKDMYAGTLKVGDPVQFVTKDGYSPLVQPVIAAIRPAKPTQTELEDVRKGLLPQIAGSCNTMVEVLFDRDCDAFKPGSLFVSQNQNGNGFLLKNCRFGPNRARGFICNASDGTVADCVFDSLDSFGILSRPSYQWLEGGAARNIRVMNCTFIDCGVFFGVHEEMERTPDCHRDISITGCRFKGRRGILDVRCCRGLATDGNSFDLPESEAIKMKHVVRALEGDKFSGLVCSGGVACLASTERTPDGDAALTIAKIADPKPGAPAHADFVRFNSVISPEQGRVYQLRFWAKADREVQISVSVALPKPPYTNFKAAKQELEAGRWRLCELVWRVDDKAFTNNTYSLPLIPVGHLAKGRELAIGPVTFERLDPVRRVRCPEWRPLKLDAPKPEYFKAKQIPGYFVKEGSVLDLSQYVPRHEIDEMGRIVADANGDLRFENAPGVRVRLRGDNCMYGGGFDGFEKMTDAEMDELANQLLRYGFNVLRFHFFDGKFVGKSGMQFHKFRNVDVSECPLPETYEELLATVDRSFLDRFHRFTAALRARGIYYMIDVFTTQTMYVKAGKNKSNLDIQLFLDERVRNHWKAAYDFLMLTPNPYTGKRPIDDPQFVAITCRNEHEHVFGGNGGNTSRLVDFTPRFREAFGAEMPEFSYALLLDATPNGDKARAFIRGEIAKLNAFFLENIRASGWRGLVTHWDMSMRNLEGDSRRGYNAVAIHPYHAHPGKEPPPPGEQARWRLEPWLNGVMQTVSRESSICYNNYISRASMTRVLGKPLLVTEISHCGANRYAQEEPVVLTAGAALQNWQLVTPHAHLVQWKDYRTFCPFSFDGGMNPMARVASVAAAFGWQRGDIAPGRHAVSMHVPESVLASRDYVGAIGSSHNSLSFVTRVGGDYERVHNPCADLDLVPESFVGVAMKGAWAELNEQMRKNDSHRAAQFTALRRAGILGAGNKTDPDRGLYESDTGQIVTDIAHETMTVDAPRFQAAALKPGAMQANLSALSVERISTPASILAISLDRNKPVAKSGHLLVVIATAFVAENSLWTRAGWNCSCDAQLEEGDYSTLMKTGRFRFSVKSQLRHPRAFAVNFDGTRGVEMPVSVEDGCLRFEWDTSTLEYATPYFEVVEGDSET